MAVVLVTRPPILTFENGEFIIDIANPRCASSFVNDEGVFENMPVFPFDESNHWYWTLNEFDYNRFKTRNLKAAAGFRRFADEKAEKIFDRVLNRALPLPSLPPLTFLDAHQVEGVKWILSRKRSYLAHAPGAGKTAQAIVAACLACLAETAIKGAIVFIVPPALIYNWEREIWKFTEVLGFPAWPSIAIVSSSVDLLKVNWAADFIIVADSMLTKDFVYYPLQHLSIAFLAVDEASRFKEPGATRTKALFGGATPKRKFKGLARNAHRTVLLDGSPMPNRPMELWAPTIALDPLAIDGMEQKDFGFRYCGARQNDRGEYVFTGSSHEQELKEKLQKNFMHVVTEDKLSHPERRRSMLFMDDVRSREHKSWESKHLTTKSFDEIDEGMNQGDIARFRQELGVRKTTWASRYIREILSYKNESIIAFVWHREVAEKLKLGLLDFKPGVIIGGVSSYDRERYIREFQEGDRRLLIINIQAGGRGYNLQKADRTIFVEFSWSDELNRQCEKRASRRGRDKENFVRSEYLVSRGSMDEPILNALFTKEKRVKKVIG